MYITNKKKLVLCIVPSSTSFVIFLIGLLYSFPLAEVYNNKTRKLYV